MPNDDGSITLLLVKTWTALRAPRRQGWRSRNLYWYGQIN